MKKIAINFAVFFDKLPDWFKKLAYYAIATTVMQILLSIQGEAGADTLTYQVIGIILVEVTKWAKNMGVEIRKTLDK